MKPQGGHKKPCFDILNEPLRHDRLYLKVAVRGGHHAHRTGDLPFPLHNAQYVVRSLPSKKSLILFSGSPFPAKGDPQDAAEQGVALAPCDNRRGAVWGHTEAFWLFWLGFGCPTLWIIGGWSYKYAVEDGGMNDPKISLPYPFVRRPPTSSPIRRMWHRRMGHRLGALNRALDRVYGVHLVEVQSECWMLDPWIQRCRYAPCYVLLLLAVGLWVACAWLIVKPQLPVQDAPHLTS